MTDETNDNMMDDLEKLAQGLQNMQPSPEARARGMDAAMAAFEAEFSPTSENISTPTQGLADSPRPTERSTGKTPVQSFGSGIMSKLNNIFSFKPQTAMMMGSCAAALLAAIVILPNGQEFLGAERNQEFSQISTEIEAEPVPQDEIVVTGRASEPEKNTVDDTAPAEDTIIVTASRIERDTEAVTSPVDTVSQAEIDPGSLGESDALNAVQDPAPAPKSAKSQGGVTSIQAVLDKVREDTANVERENREREEKFRQRRDYQAALISNPRDELRKMGVEVKTDPNASPAEQYRQLLQAKDNVELFVSQQDIVEQAEMAEAQKIANFEIPNIDRSQFKISVSDRDAQPLVRIPPEFPARADKSGHCRMSFDVGADGSPTNVRTTFCTEDVFEEASIRSVQKWKFNPKIVNGEALAREGVESKVTFRLADEQGYIIPEPIVPQAKSRDRFEKAEPYPIMSVKEEPVSTFSVDVDTASYTFLRASVNNGQLPPPKAIRVEEMINYFPYDYTAPTSPDEPFKANVTVTPTPWNADTKLMHIGIKGYTPPADERPDSNIVFLIDTSGSMNQTNKLPLLINSFKLLLSTLTEDDIVSIVTYAGSAGTILEPTPASETGTIKAALNRLQAGGSTAGAAGLELAYQKAQENFDDEAVNRVILATDGDFNVGFSSPEEMKTFIADKLDSGIFLSVLGFGQGNYNDELMQSLAQNGNGVAAYIDTLSEAQKVLADASGSALFTIAKDVKIQVEFNPDTIAEYRLIGYETRALKRQDFNNDKVDAGEINAGHTVTAIYELTPVGSPAQVMDDLRYASETASTGSDEFAFVKIRHKKPDSDTSELQTFPIGPDQERDLRRATDDMRFATAVAAVGQKLRGDTQVADYSYADAIALANSAKGADENGYRAEFVQLAKLIESLDE